MSVGLFCRSQYSVFVTKNVEPDQTPHYVASDLGVHCLPMTLLRMGSCCSSARSLNAAVKKGSFIIVAISQSNP